MERWIVRAYQAALLHAGKKGEWNNKYYARPGTYVNLADRFYKLTLLWGMSEDREYITWSPLNHAARIINIMQAKAQG